MIAGRSAGGQLNSASLRTLPDHTIELPAAELLVEDFLACSCACCQQEPRGADVMY